MNKTDGKGRNYKPTGKEVFVLYECPNCHRNDCCCIPPFMNVKIPYFIKCDCGAYVMYKRAWIVEPYKAADVLSAWVTGNKDIIKELKPGGKFKEVTDKLEPDGTMDTFKMLNIEIDAEPDIDEKRLKKKPKKNYKPKSAKQICPVCENEFIIKDIDLYLERMEEAWNVVKKALPEAYKRQMEDEIYKRNHPDNIRKYIKEKGYFTGFCQPCMGKMSWSKQLELGL